MKLVYQYIEIFFDFYTTSNHLHPLQVENCDSNSRLVVDEDDNGKLRPERVKNDHSGSHAFRRFICQFLTDFLVILQRLFSSRIHKKSQTYV